MPRFAKLSTSKMSVLIYYTELTGQGNWARMCAKPEALKRLSIYCTPAALTLSGQLGELG
jgi:hypothetical protein